MKTWDAPRMEDMNIRQTSTCVDTVNYTSGQKDLGTCSNPYWAGNGLSYEEAEKKNPYWSGSWGN